MLLKDTIDILIMVLSMRHINKPRTTGDSFDTAAADDVDENEDEEELVADVSDHDDEED